MRCLTLLFCLMPVVLQANGVYKEVLPDGSVIYSDRPGEGAVEVQIDPLQTVTPPPKPAKPPEQTPPEPASDRIPTYEALSILQPKDDVALRDNAGNVTIEVEVKPRLWVQQGHRLAVELDGTRLAGRFTGTRMELSNVDRGSHDLVVVILDRSGNVVRRSAPHRFHLQRHSILFNR